MAALKAHDALAEAREAAEAEGIFEPTAEQIADLRRYKELKTRQDAIKTEMDAIKDRVVGQMREAGAKCLAVNGKNWVNIAANRTPTQVVDFDEMSAKFPEVVAAYQSALVQFTRTVPATGDRVIVKPV